MLLTFNSDLIRCLNTYFWIHFSLKLVSQATKFMRINRNILLNFFKNNEIRWPWPITKDIQSTKPIKTRKKLHVADAKRGNMCTSESRLVLVSLLIGWQSGASSLSQSFSVVIETKANANYFRHSTEIWSL